MSAILKKYTHKLYFAYTFFDRYNRLQCVYRKERPYLYFSSKKVAVACLALRTRTVARKFQDAYVHWHPLHTLGRSDSPFLKGEDPVHFVLQLSFYKYKCTYSIPYSLVTIFYAHTRTYRHLTVWQQHFDERAYTSILNRHPAKSVLISSRRSHCTNRFESFKNWTTLLCTWMFLRCFPSIRLEKV